MSFMVDWRVLTKSERLNSMSTYFQRVQVPENSAAKLASSFQYHYWPRTKLSRLVAKRENPAFKCLPYNPLMTRKQRYATLSCALVVAGFFSVLLFNAPCVMVPKPAVCKAKASFWMQFLTWDAVFASIWGVILSVPHPLVLILLFKKRVVLPPQTPEQKRLTLRLWLWKERAGWTVVLATHVIAIFVMSQFVRYYSWEVIQKWTAATLWAVVHRFATAPGVRLTWVLLLLCGSRHAGICDLCLLMSPSFLDFPPMAQVVPATKSAPVGGRSPAFLWAKVRSAVHAGLVIQKDFKLSLSDQRCP